MMGLYILSFFIAIVLIIYWAKENDTVPMGGKTTGIYRMPSVEPAAAGNGPPDRLAAGRAASNSRVPGGTDALVRRQ